MRRLAIFLPNWLGDAAMATPALRAVRNHFPNSRIVAVCKPYVVELFTGSPWFDGVIRIEKKAYIGSLRQLQHERPDAALLFPNSLRAALLAKLAGCKTIVGFARYCRDTLLTHRLYAKRDRFGSFKPSPILDDYNRLAMALGAPDPGRRLQLFTTSNDELAAERFWQQARLERFASVIGLNPGGAFGAGKHWPTEHFADLARMLAVRGHGVVVLCGPSEREEAIRIAAAAKHPNVVSLSEPLSIGLTKAVVKKLSLLVTTDSGPRHFAHAFNVPVVSLFGPTHIAWTDTHFEKAVHLQERVPCGPCQQRVCPLGHHECMTKLSSNRVLEASLELLRRYAPEVRDAG